MKDWVKIRPETTVSELANILSDHSTGSALVVEGHQPLGIVTERDILKKVVASGIDPKETKVKHIMTSPVITIDAKESVSKASDLMGKESTRRLVVVENGKVVGKITTNIVSVNYRYRLARSVASRIPYYGKYR